MLIALLGNFGVPWCSEVHFAASLEALGHTVTRIQEGETLAVDVPARVAGHELFMWVQTYSLAEQGGTVEQRAQMLDTLRGMGVPSVGYHLDKWFGLSRAHQVAEQPFFRCDAVFTADGDHDGEFAAAGVNHFWMPPGVYHAEVGLGTHRAEFACEIAFVGNWRGEYHPEDTERRALIRFLRSRYGRRIRFFPQPGQPAVRGQDLNDLYASAKVMVGASCMAATSSRYTSDRPYETVGRGGFLLYPFIQCVADELIDGEHIRYYQAGDHAQLGALIEHYLDAARDAERARIQAAGVQRVSEGLTYMHRMQAMLDTVARDGILRSEVAA